MKSFVSKAKDRCYARTRKEIDLLVSQLIDIGAVKTVCLALGPYRNLTTLTASVLFLHPHCQVLNHGGRRIFGDKRLDFIGEYSRKRFENFVRYAIHISKKGRRGDHGGSITLSHAFDDKHSMKEIFDGTQLSRTKRNITTLFWKESLKTTNHIRQSKCNLTQLFAENKQVRFLLPIRNPLDCAVSNIKTGHVNRFQSVDRGSSVEEVVEAILEELLWFKKLEMENHERFFYYFEHECNRATLKKMADFLELEASEEWLMNSMEAFNVKSQYNHSRRVMSCFKDSVERKFAEYPVFAEQLLRCACFYKKKDD
jgi:hypothetical protein